MARSLLLLLASFFLSLTASNAVDFPAGTVSLPSCSDHGSQKSIACAVEEAKLKFALLESILDEKIGDLNARTQYLGDCQRRIEEFTSEIDRLKTELSNFKEDHSRKNVKLSALEEEVRLLWEASRKNNFEIYDLEQKAFDAERRLKAVASQFEETSQIVSEQWIQIQKFEQALYMVEVFVNFIPVLARSRHQKLERNSGKDAQLLSVFLKSLMGILDPYVPRDGSMFASLKSKAFQTFAAVKHYHYQLHSMCERLGDIVHENFVLVYDLGVLTPAPES
ncbi:hypothetical protein SASPL_117143 [Salvia splendens]|uniref:Uncharacterized protein n=1 Tax=Salvia splendens TaxID=180675 RepID=A0A8X8XUZ9_SALSN|nr:hypothetical protein SASPL_117143 [Salvia splendens]